MKYICHRGNTLGSNPIMENKPEYIQKALEMGYDAEVDVWLQSDGFYLGHDAPNYKITRNFIQNQKLWVHCKNIDAYLELFNYSNVNCFFQENEKMVMTSRGYLWAHSSCTKWNNKTVVVSLIDKPYFNDKQLPFALCSDFIYNNGNDLQSLPFDLLILDIDGVMTNGTKMYDREAKVFGKTYCDLDFTAIKRFKAAGVQVCFLSGDENVNKMMAETRKIHFFHNPPGIDKVDILQEIKNYYKSNRIAYIGDDYYDLTIMNSVDLAFCPNTSPIEVRQNAIMIDVPAGMGVVAGLYDKYHTSIPYSFPIDSSDVNPK